MCAEQRIFRGRAVVSQHGKPHREPIRVYRVLRDFDFYRVGQAMRPEDVADQKRRGNLPDLLRNGFIAQEAEENEENETEFSLEALRERAKAAGIGHYWVKNAETLLEELASGDN